MQSDIPTLAHALGHLVNRALVHTLAPGARFGGRNHLPHRGPYILASNHLSHADSALIACAVHRRLSFMAMSELFDLPLWGKLARWCGAFPVERGKADRKALTHAGALLAAGRALLIYPEGYLAPDGKMGTVLPGAALLALRGGVPLIPVGISNSTALMPYGPTRPRLTLAPIEVHFGAPVQLADLAGLGHKEAREIASARMEAAMRAAVSRADTAVRLRGPHGVTRRPRAAISAVMPESQS